MKSNRSIPAANHNRTEIPAAIGNALLILLFCYAAFSKLAAPEVFRRQMLNQVFTPAVNLALFYLLPPAELAAAILLLFRRSRLAGLWLSFALMSAFTGYVALVLLHAWHRVPCSCGGVLNKLKWGPHLLFNCFFLLVTISTIVLELKERRAGDHAANR